MDETRIDQIIDEHEGKASALIQILVGIQGQNGWLPKEALEKVSERLNVPLSRVQHAATFHKSFSLAPGGRHRVHVCNGTSCHMRGAQRIVDKVQDLIGIEPGETDPEQKFSFKTVMCMGQCASGPVMEVDGKHHGSVEPSRAEGVLEKCD